MTSGWFLVIVAVVIVAAVGLASVIFAGLVEDEHDPELDEREARSHVRPLGNVERKGRP